MMTVGQFVPVRREAVGFETGKWHRELYGANSLKGVVTDGLPASDAKAIADVYCGECEQHFERRVQLFFLQLLSVWKTPYHFEWQEANDQYGKGKDHRILDDAGRRVVFKTEAAHSSTFPCLVAYPRGVHPRPQGFVYLKHGHSYTQHNATIELPRFFNRADILIDGTHTDSRLRNEAIKVINAVAEGQYGVREGMKRYMGLLDAAIDKGMEVGDADDRYVALERYSEWVTELMEDMEEDSGFFDRLLGVKIGDPEKEAVLRDVVFASRFKLIQGVETIESEIARKILDAQNEMLGVRREGLKSLDYRLRYVLLEEGDSDFRRVLERLFCTSLAQLQVGIEQNEARLRAFEGRARIRSFRETHSDRVANLKRDLRVLIREMGQKELHYRSALFKGLRWDFHHWSQSKFAAEFKGKNPGEPMSQAMVSRLEQRTRAAYEAGGYLTPLNQRRKDLEVAKAMKVADAFGVDPGLFLPSVVSSVYA
ncbi:MAG: hypothetical protein P0S96_01460 [Simkaniaceae bacterium]|nr:hypothetical protein [Candidatus Sacchlamyda saccharinae]